MITHPSMVTKSDRVEVYHASIIQHYDYKKMNVMDVREMRFEVYTHVNCNMMPTFRRIQMRY